MGDLPARMAWSVHAADDELRKKLVPTTQHRMAELRDAFVDVLTGTKRNMLVQVLSASSSRLDSSQLHAQRVYSSWRSDMCVCVFVCGVCSCARCVCVCSLVGDGQVTMMEGVNDSPEHARQLAALLHPLRGWVKVNLLPYNDTGNALRSKHIHAEACLSKTLHFILSKSAFPAGCPCCVFDISAAQHP